MPPENPDDETSITLMARVRRDPTDLRAWEEFVGRYQPMIRDWCLRWGSRPEDAEDVAQEVLLKLLAAMRTFRYDPGRSFRAWLKTVTQNAWIDFGKAHRRESVGDPDRFRAILDAQALDDLSGRMVDAYDREWLEVAMRRVERRVKPANWRAFHLTAMEGLSGAEAAAELGMTVARVFIAKHRVQRMLEEEVMILRGEPA